MTSFKITLAVVSADWSGNATISIHLVNWSVTNRAYLFPLAVLGNCPRRSLDKRSKGAPTGMLPNGALGL